MKGRGRQAPRRHASSTPRCPDAGARQEMPPSRCPLPPARPPPPLVSASFRLFELPTKAYTGTVGSRQAPRWVRLDSLRSADQMGSLLIPAQDKGARGAPEATRSGAHAVENWTRVRWALTSHEESLRGEDGVDRMSRNSRTENRGSSSQRSSERTSKSSASSSICSSHYVRGQNGAEEVRRQIIQFKEGCSME